MAKVQDCFQLEEKLKERCEKQGVNEGTNKSIVYRKAILEYLEKNEPKYEVKK